MPEITGSDWLRELLEVSRNKVVVRGHMTTSHTIGLEPQVSVGVRISLFTISRHNILVVSNYEKHIPALEHEYSSCAKPDLYTYTATDASLTVAGGLLCWWGSSNIIHDGWHFPKPVVLGRHIQGRTCGNEVVAPTSLHFLQHLQAILDRVYCSLGSYPYSDETETKHEERRKHLRRCSRD